MEVLGYTTTETLLWDYSEVEEYHVLVRPPARPRRTLYVVPWWYAYHWFHLFGGTDLRIVYYPFKNVRFGDVPEPTCDAEIIEIFASITVSPSSVDENGGIDLIFTITLDSASAFDTEITYSVSGTASQGDDYIASFINPIVILAGQTTATIVVTPVDDVLDEDDETVIVTLFSGNSGTNIVTISAISGSATGTIVSEDIVIPTVTWDPPTAVNVALSNGNLTATNEGIEGIQGVQATVSFDSGKYYFEVTATSGPLSLTFPFTRYNLGIGPPAGSSLYSFLANRWGFGAGLQGAGVGSANGADSPIGGSALNESIVTGDVIGIAVDLDANRMWFRSMAGPSYPNPLSWNGSADWGGSPGVGADNDPATSVGGMVIPTGTMAGLFTPTAIFNDDNLTEAMTFNFGDSAFSGDVPFDYTAGWGSTTKAVLDSVTATDVILSNGNLTATSTGNVSVFPYDQGVQVAPVAAQRLGKFYIEFTYNNVTDTGSGFGIWNRSTSYSLLDTAGFGGVIATPLFGRIFSEGSIIGFMNPVVPTDVIGVAIDLDHHKVWFKNVAGPNSPSDWNTDALADPATNVGGLTIPAGSVVPVICFDGTGTGVAGEQWTANFGDSVFSGIVPSGYSSGWREGTTSDPYWEKVVFLCGFNHSSCDESTTNNKGDGGVATTVFGSYGFNSTTKRYGTSSAFIRLNGIRWADSPDWNFTGNFTIEISYYTVSVAVGTATIISQWTTTGSQQSWRIVQVGATIRWEVSTTGANTFTDLTSGAILANTYYDIMVDYDGTKYRLYLNGVMAASSSSTARVIFNSTSMMSIGSNPTGGANTGDNVFPDEARITKGVARCGSDGGYTVVGPFPRYVYTTSGTTLDPATANKVILSNGDLTVTNAQVVVPEQIVSIPLIYAKSSGKYYYEITLQLEDNNGNSVISFGLTTATYTGLVIDGGGDGIIAYESGNLFANEIFETPRICVDGGSFGGCDSGDVIGVAVDFDHGNVWVNIVGGPNAGFNTWNGANLGDLKENPSTNSGGVFLLAGSAFVPFATFTGDEAVGVNSETANFGATSFIGPLPTGFTSGWPISGGNTPVTLNTWDSTTAFGVTLSNGNLTATNQGGAGNQGVKSLVRKTGGKFYFEITINHVNLASTNFCFGVSATNTSYDSILAGTNMGQVFVFLSGAIRQNGGSAGESLGTALHDGDVIGVAVNLLNNFDNYCWFKIVAGPDAAGAQWNGDVGANPTNTNTGVYIDTNTVTPFLIFGDTDATEQMTANFGATAFSGTVPSGFTAGWPA